MLRDRLSGLHRELDRAVTECRGGSPHWIYQPLVHSLDEVADVVRGLDADEITAIDGATAIAARAEMALELWRTWRGESAPTRFRAS